MSIDFAVTNKFYQGGEFAETESVNNKDALYVFFPTVYACTLFPYILDVSLLGSIPWCYLNLG